MLLLPRLHLLRCLFALFASWAGQAAAAAPVDAWDLPISRKTLDNGLVVLVSPDPTSPTVGVSMVYHVGMRLEPRGRTGFAHLFEHLMFQGTPKAPKGVLDRVISGGGGDINGSTRPDFTNYIAGAPVSALEPILWLEADRMTTLDFSPANLKNQQDVVKEEIRSNVTNSPYGAVMWIDIAALAFDKWENAHDGYGSFEDLDRATLDDVRAFHRDYYGPNNAVLSIAGDVTPERAFALAEKYFGAIPRRPTPPRADTTEPLNTTERRLSQTDALAQVPALVAAWKVPARGSPDHAAMVVLGELLSGGDASRLHQALVKGQELALGVSPLWGLTGPWQYDGPTLYTLFIPYKPGADAESLLTAIDAAVARVRDQGVDDATLARLKTRLRADWINGLEGIVDRADTLAQLQLLWGDARVVNQIPRWIDAVTSADVQRAAATYLTAANRSVIDRRPAGAAPGPTR